MSEVRYVRKITVESDDGESVDILVTPNEHVDITIISEKLESVTRPEGLNLMFTTRPPVHNRGPFYLWLRESGEPYTTRNLRYYALFPETKVLEMYGEIPENYRLATDKEICCGVDVSDL